METRPHKYAAIRLTSLSTRLSKLILCAGLVVTLLQPASLFAEAWNVLTSGDASGTWNTPANWNPSTVPNGVSAIADFSTQDMTVDSTITLNLAATVNRLVFGDMDPLSSAGWTLSPVASQALTLGGTSPTIEVNALGTGKSVNMNVILAGSAGMIKNGSGTLLLSKLNTYTSGTIISNGIVKFGIANAIASGNVRIESPGILDINGWGYQNINQLNGNGTFDNTGASSRSVVVGNGDTWSTFSGIIKSTVSGYFFTKNGAGTCTWSGPNTFDGSMRIQGGKLSINSIGNIGSAEPTALGTPKTIATGYIYLGSGGVSGGTLVYTGTGHSTDRCIDLDSSWGNCVIEASGSGALIFKTNIISSGIGAKTFILSGIGTSTNEISGPIQDNGTVGSTKLTVAFSAGTNMITLSSVSGFTTGASISGTGIDTDTAISAINSTTRVVTLSKQTILVGPINSTMTIPGVINRTSVTKSNTGKWILSGFNTYTGPTTVSDGTLIINGTLSADSTVTVAASKTLGGYGIIYGTATLSNGANLKPGGDDIGTLTFANTGASALTLNKNTSHVGLPNVTGPVDKIAISGGLVLNGTNKIVLAYTGYPRSGTHTIMTYASLTTDSTGTFVFDQEYHPTPTLTVGDTSVTVTIPGEGTVLRFL
jgi:autotransporter-associated beta strand protein